MSMVVTVFYIFVAHLIGRITLFNINPIQANSSYCHVTGGKKEKLLIACSTQQYLPEEVGGAHSLHTEQARIDS
jgi:hypothetical protein